MTSAATATPHDKDLCTIEVLLVIGINNQAANTQFTELS